MEKTRPSKDGSQVFTDDGMMSVRQCIICSVTEQWSTNNLLIMHIAGGVLVKMFCHRVFFLSKVK